LEVQTIRHESGFTLVELSIVIVIIGLIVAGIVGGQALVRQAQLKSILSDHNKYTVAINSFKLEYGGLPGDLNNANDFWTGCNSGATATQCNSNGDKKINHFATYAPLTTPLVNDNESIRAWQHLSLAKLLPSTLTGVANVNGTSQPELIPGVNIPKGPLNKSGWLLVYILASWGATMGNAMNFAGCGYLGTDNLGGGCPYTPLKPKDAYLVDIKGDDGIARKGTIIAGGNFGANACMLDQVVYNIHLDSVLCTLLFYSL
jgi:prepilin-type N-terminal cleavage/methylation domain-containing protein